MARKAKYEFDEAAMEKEYSRNLEEAKTGRTASFGIFADLPQWDSFYFEAGKKYTVRFIPWLEGGDPEKPRWFLKIPVHKYVGPEGNKRDYVCLSHYGKKCPLCEELERKSSNRYFYNIRYRDDNGKFVPAIVEVNVNFHETLCKVSERTDPDTGMVKTVYFMSPTKGTFVGFAGEEVQRGTFKWVEPGRVGFGEPSPIDDRWLEEAVDLHSHVRVFSAEQLSGALFGQHPDSVDAGGDRPSGRRNVQDTVTETPPASAPVGIGVSGDVGDDKPVLPDVPPATGRRGTSSEPSPDNVDSTPPAKLCSRGFPFGSPEHSGKHKACDSCPDAEYNECVQVAGAAGVK